MNLPSFLAVFARTSLRTRITLTLVGLAGLTAVYSAVHTSDDFRRAEQAHLEERGIAIAKEIAANGAEASLSGDDFVLFTLVSRTLAINGEVRYAFIVERSGRVRVHTFQRGVPFGLADLNVPAPGQPYRVQVIKSNEGYIRDVAVPMQGGEGGIVRIGLTESRLRAEVGEYTRRLVLAALLGGAVAAILAYLLATILTRPIARLVEVAKATPSSGASRPRGDVGHLEQALTSMSGEILKSRDELLRLNHELLALNAIADTLIQRLTPDEMTEGALDKLLEIMGLDGGWIVLQPNGETPPALAAHRLRYLAGADDEPCPPINACVCPLLRERREALLPQLDLCPNVTYASSHDLQAVACVPIISSAGVVGSLFVGAKEKERLEAHERRLLASACLQMGMALDNGWLYEEVRRKEEARGQLLKEFIQAQEDERKKLARELHDETGQTLTGVLLTLENVAKTLPAANSRQRRAIERSRDVTRQALNEVYSIIMRLRPTILDDLGLVPALEWYLAERFADQQVTVDFHAEGIEGSRLPAEIEITIYRVIQEAANNVAKHAGATSVSVRLVAGPGSIVGSVQDDGRGFTLSAQNGNARGGFGLKGIRERLEHLGSSLSLKSEPGKGTALRFEIPIVAPVGTHRQSDIGGGGLGHKGANSR